MILETFDDYDDDDFNSAYCFTNYFLKPATVFFISVYIYFTTQKYIL